MAITDILLTVVGLILGLAAALILLQLRTFSRRIDRAEDRAENRASEDRAANKADHDRLFNAVSDLKAVVEVLRGRSDRSDHAAPTARWNGHGPSASRKLREDRVRGVVEPLRSDKMYTVGARWLGTPQSTYGASEAGLRQPQDLGEAKRTNGPRSASRTRPACGLFRASSMTDDVPMLQGLML